MTKKIYYLFLSLGFGSLFLPILVNVIAHRQVIPYLTSPGTHQAVLFFLICWGEARFIKNPLLRIPGFVLPFVWFQGWQYKIMHWPHSSYYILVSTIAMLVSFVVMDIIEKNKNILNYLCMIWLLHKSLHLSFHWLNSKTGWWLDFLALGLIFVLALFYFLRTLSQSRSSSAHPTNQENFIFEEEN